MNLILKYNRNGYEKFTGNDFSVLNVHLNDKPSVKTQLLNTFKDHFIVVKLCPTAKIYDEWLLSNTIWIKIYHYHGKYKAEFSQYFQMYYFQPNLAMFCATSVLSVSLQYVNHQNFLLWSVCPFHINLHV